MYQLMIKAFGSPSPMLFKYETFERAVSEALVAMRDGCHKSETSAIFLGDGSILSVVSDEALQEEARAVEEAKKSGGLVIGGKHEVKEEDFLLHVQFGGSVIPPMRFSKEESRDKAFDEAYKTRRITYVTKEKHDVLYIMVGSGVGLFKISGKAFLEKRREAVAMMQQQLAAQQAAAQKDEPRLHLPFGLGRR